MVPRVPSCEYKTFNRFEAMPRSFLRELHCYE